MKHFFHASKPQTELLKGLFRPLSIHYWESSTFRIPRVGHLFNYVFSGIKATHCRTALFSLIYFFFIFYFSSTILFISCSTYHIYYFVTDPCFAKLCFILSHSAAKLSIGSSARWTVKSPWTRNNEKDRTEISAGICSRIEKKKIIPINVVAR